MKITFQTKAWLTEYNHATPAELMTEQGAASLYYSDTDLSSVGYTVVGTAEITVDLLGERDMINNKVSALREQAASIRAEASAKCTKIEGQIQQLLCIENSAAPA